ncbi:MAG: transcriptional regulator [Bacteroidetes bacterium 46-16]|nr:MAG: transcriptional regulator [Bacteroidetes bacterium 46-16]
MKGKKAVAKSKNTANKATDASEYIKKLGERIRTLRIKKGYSSHEIFAYEHNFPRAQYGRYERGQDIKYSSLLKLVEAFDMTLEEFFSEGFE